ncbi:MAG: cytochrome c3 family protein [bacterium]
MKKTLFLVIIFGLYGLTFAQSHSKLNLDCKTCHECDTPTKTNPCLIACPRTDMVTIHNKPEEGPAKIVMNYFLGVENIYEPVTFSHFLHAEMAGISGGCKTCHHFNNTGNILKCVDCHEVTRARNDISKPDLKGALHRQCIDCHREWSGNAECGSCHATNSDKKTKVKSGTDKTAKVHPEIVEPNRLVFETNYKEGKIVTFYHNEHTDVYGIECGSCHKNESCAKCHDKTGHFTKTKKDANQKHKPCASCHNVQKNCNFCHSSEIKAPFNHYSNTGFDIGEYHGRLSCNKCHKQANNFKGLSSNCNVCHSAWNSTNFKHEKTGIILDEIHIENDCEDCHIDRNFKAKPSCENCHGDDIKYPASVPGKKIRK